MGTIVIVIRMKAQNYPVNEKNSFATVFYGDWCIDVRRSIF